MKKITIFALFILTSNIFSQPNPIDNRKNLEKKLLTTKQEYKESLMLLGIITCLDIIGLLGIHAITKQHQCPHEFVIDIYVGTTLLIMGGDFLLATPYRIQKTIALFMQIKKLEKELHSTKQPN